MLYAYVSEEGQERCWGDGGQKKIKDVRWWHYDNREIVGFRIAYNIILCFGWFDRDVTYTFVNQDTSVNQDFHQNWDNFLVS